MAVVERTVAATPAAVFAVLTTPSTYPFWLIGCKDIRAVDDGWPAPGTAFHHRVGLVGPLTVADSTKVLEVQGPRRLVLEVRARPFGRGRVTFTVEPDGEGSDVSLDEVPLGMLDALQPVLDPPTAHRNAQSLERLAAYLDADHLLHQVA